MQPLSREMKNALIAQIGMEYSNALAYWSMEWSLRSQTWCGMSEFMHEQASDERHHGKKLACYLIERGEEPPLRVTEPNPPMFYGQTPLEVFSAAYELEKATSTSIETLMHLSEDEGDSATMDVLQWYVGEQIEEEKTMRKLVKKLQLAGSNDASLRLIDKGMK